jgi:hypothetical protein
MVLFDHRRGRFAVDTFKLDSLTICDLDDAAALIVSRTIQKSMSPGWRLASGEAMPGITQSGRR